MDGRHNLMHANISVACDGTWVMEILEYSALGNFATNSFAKGRTAPKAMPAIRHTTRSALYSTRCCSAPRSTMFQNPHFSFIPCRLLPHSLRITPVKLSPICVSSSTQTPLVPLTFRSLVIHVKRDDLLSLHGVTGSKVRKFHSLLDPETLHPYEAIISYGGAQSNAMLALASLCRQHSRRFIYITKPVPTRLKSSLGNLRSALDMTMCHVPVSHDMYRKLIVDSPPCDIEPRLSKYLADKNILPSNHPYLFIPQGGAWNGAEPGIRVLARELADQVRDLRSQHVLHPHRKPILFLPCGTGTTAFYLQKHLSHVARVVAVPVSGDERYLIKQMKCLSENYEKNRGLEAPNFPDVIRPRLPGTFADIRKEKLVIWKELQRAAGGTFQFDLVYAPKAWEEVMLAIEEKRLRNNNEDVIYYHTGGVEGNISMLDRFKNKGLL